MYVVPGITFMFTKSWDCTLINAMFNIRMANCHLSFVSMHL